MAEFRAAAKASGIEISTHYNSPEYWTERYTNDKIQFDWLLRYASFRDVLLKYTTRSSYVLDAGCGSSRLGEDMIGDGFENVVGVDSCSVVIGDMRAKHAMTTGLSYEEKDAFTLDGIPDETVECVIAKAILDSLLCGEGGPENAAKLVAAARRVLKTGGVLVVVSLAPPQKRGSFFSPSHWKVTTHKVEKPTPDANDPYHFIYACVKL